VPYSDTIGVLLIKSESLLSKIVIDHAVDIILPCCFEEIIYIYFTYSHKRKKKNLNY
jgi:hypothetical protein